MLYQEVRPENLDEIVGCEDIVKSLKAVIANKSRPHVFLFHGPTGTGKTTFTRILTRELGCHPINIIEKNAANERGIDMVRQLEEMSKFSPMGGGNRMVILDEAHMLTKEAQNAALKLLEDIPKYQYYILCTTKPGGLLDTIRSRCDEYETTPLKPDQMREVLLQAIVKADLRKVSDDVMGSIIEVARGSARTALMKLGRCAKMETDQDALQVLTNNELAGMSDEIIEKAQDRLREPDLLWYIANDLEAVGISGEQNLALAIYLAGTSRLLDKPIAIIVQGASSAGKSYIIQTVAKLFPDEAVVQAHAFTPQSLIYMPYGSLVHAFFVAGEREHSKSKTATDGRRGLREMLADGKLTRLVTTKTKKGPKTELKEQPGPMSYVESTTLSSDKIFAEDLNRCIALHVDESSLQTQRILTDAGRKYADEKSNPKHEKVIQLNHAMQRLLRPAKVKIRYAEWVLRQLPADTVQSRRAHEQLMGMVGASALLHQFQRERLDDGTIIATGADFDIAIDIMAEPLAQQLSVAPSELELRLVEVAETLPQPFTATALKSYVDDYSASSVEKGLKSLRDKGAVEVVRKNKGRLPAQYQLQVTAKEFAATRLEIKLPEGIKGMKGWPIGPGWTE